MVCAALPLEDGISYKRMVIKIIKKFEKGGEQICISSS